MKILKEAGLPDGVINFIPDAGPLASSIALPHKDLAGVNFIGSTGTFNTLWKGVADNLDTYRSYPRVAGETGGKNFHFVHESADVVNVVMQTIRGAFDYQGQKCSATSRMYVPTNLWEGGLKDLLAEETAKLKMGCSSDFSSYLCAVIDQTSFDKVSGFVERAKASDDAEILVGGGCDDSVGYFIEPTVIVTENPQYETMANELFGPVLTVCTYDPDKYVETLKECDATSVYGLTGSIFAQDRAAVREADTFLVQASGNYYVNDKCTGAAVGEQPFGGARKSGTNDKSGTIHNNLKWTSGRTIKENFVDLGSPLWPCNQPEN
jgi:1-pyrroline-5-carboxylate dehydrogenase